MAALATPMVLTPWVAASGLSQSLEKAVKGPGRGRISRREPSLKTTPTRPFLGLLTNFATGPYGAFDLDMDRRLDLELREAA